MKFAIFLTLSIFCLGCKHNFTQDNKIIKIEKEYKADCFPKDSCLSIQKIFYQDGSYTRTYYVRYPDMKRVMYFKSNDIWLYEIAVAGNDSIKTENVYDEKGNLSKTINIHLTKDIPNEIKEYKNFFDNNGRLKTQFVYNYKGEKENIITVFYDTLNFTKVEYEKKCSDSTSVAERYYQNNKLVKLNDFWWPVPYEYSYDDKGRFVFEDPIHEPQIRRFYLYKKELLIEIQEKFKLKNGSVSTDTFDYTKFSYELDNRNRPIRIIKTTYSNGHQTYKTITKVEYK
jgi:hypothetical protein